VSLFSRARSGHPISKDGANLKPSPTAERPPSAQVEPAKKAAALKAASGAKRAQAFLATTTPAPPRETLPAEPKRLRTADQPQGAPVRLLSKSEVCALANATFPSIWAWMRAGKFPRARVVGGRSMWLSTEIDQWLAGLPVRRLKGDPTEAEPDAGLKRNV
jgi:predicted DNA-binding transcriptional regulator AlpA